MDPNTAKKISISVAVLLVVLIVGIALGMVFQTIKNAPQLQFAEKMGKVVKALSSKTTVSIVMYGQVTGINARNLTLDFGGESYTLGIKQDAVVYSFSAKNNTQQVVKFEDIKVGQNVSVNLKLSSDGQLEGQTVFILPLTETK